MKRVSGPQFSIAPLLWSALLLLWGLQRQLYAITDMQFGVPCLIRESVFGFCCLRFVRHLVLRCRR